MERKTTRKKTEMLEKNKEWKPFAYKRGCERKRTEEIEKMIGGEVMRLLN
jgi:hypothetical protein